MRNNYCWAALLLWIFCCQPSERNDAQPNILLIITDDQGWGDLGFRGNEIVETPNLDRFANNALIFDRFYVSPVCAPTRASLLTGRYHLTTGVTWVTHRKEVMSQYETTIAEFLKSNGFRTGLFGKWHNGKQYPHDPTGQGFDRFLGFKEGHFNNYFDPELISGLSRVKTSGYLPDILTDSAIAFMESGKPFFSLVSYNTPHSPFQVPDHFFDKHKRKGLNDRLASIYGMVENIDENVGRLLAALDRLGKTDNTIVIFMSDNGPNGERFNNGWKGIKAHVDEGGVRVPFLMRYPRNGWGEGRQINEMVAHIDLMPTLIDLVDPDFKGNKPLHGRSLIPLIEGRIAEPRYLFTHQVQWDFDTIPGAIRSDNFLLTLKNDGIALYDLINDPLQQRDVAAIEPDRADILQTVYHEWFRQMLEEMPDPEPIETGHTHVREVEFPAQEANILHSVEFAGKAGWANDYLINFSDGSRVGWETKTVDTCRVRVSMQVHVDAGTEMKLTIGAMTFNLRFDTANFKTRIPSPDRVERGEVYGYRWPEITLGDVELFPGQNWVIVESSEISELELKSIKLSVF